MLTTTNYGLKKPEGTDIVNIDDLNNNVDIIDMKLKEIDIKASNIIVPVTKVNSKTGDVVLNANDIGITDTGNKTTTTNVEDALQETYNKIDILSGSNLEEKANKSDFDTHKNDYTTFKNSKGQASGLASLGSDGKVPSGQLPVIKDVDNGRYQSEFGLDGATLNNVDITNGIASITNTVIGSPLSLNGTWSTYSLTYGQGLVIQPKMLISKLVLGIYSGQSGYSRLRILKYSDNSVIATQTVTGLLTATFDNLNLQVGTKYKLVLDNNGSAWTEAQVNSFSSFPITTSSEFDVINSIHNDADSSLYLQAFSSIQAYSNTALTGTATKTIAPSDLKKWGNAKWTQTTLTNTSVVCDILKSDGTTVLKSNIASVSDLSDIDITANPIIKAKWTLTRVSIGDTSPTVSDASVTWEGKNGSYETWEKITDITLPNSVAQVDFTNLSSLYRRFKIFFHTSSINSANGDLNIIVNDLISQSYKYCAIDIESSAQIYNGTSTGCLPLAKAVPDTLNSFNKAFGEIEISINLNNVSILAQHTTMYGSSSVVKQRLSTCNIISTITSIAKITLSSPSCSMIAGCNFTLWGCK